MPAEEGGTVATDCEITTLPPDCDPEPDMSSMPVFGAVLFIGIIFNFALNIICFMTWKPRVGAIEPGSQELAAMQLPADQAVKSKEMGSA